MSKATLTLSHQCLRKGSIDSVKFDAISIDESVKDGEDNQQYDGGVDNKKGLTPLLETNLDEVSLGGSQSTLSSVKDESEGGKTVESDGSKRFSSEININIDSVSDEVKDGELQNAIAKYLHQDAKTGATGQQEMKVNTSKSSSTEDENRNKVFELRVDRKGNIGRISVVQEEGGLARESSEIGGEDDIFVTAVGEDEMTTIGYSSHCKLSKKEIGSQTDLVDNVFEAGI